MVKSYKKGKVKMNEILEKNIEENENIDNKIEKNPLKSFNWGWFKFTKCVMGLLIYCIGINLFVVPNNLYTGGILGLSQLLRSAIVQIFNIDVNFDISAIIYYLINIPLFVISMKKLSKTFFMRTLFAVSLNALFLTIIPIPNAPLLNDLLANVLIGGALAGIGIGMALSTGSSTGGIDIIGIILSKKSKKITVGNIGLIFNVFIYVICGINYGIEIMIYSIIYAVFETILLDRNHIQNIYSQTFIFTKKNPDKLIHFINAEINRGATYWEAIGGYTKEKTYIVCCVLSKYERMRLERHMNEFDEKAFMVGKDGVEIKGLFNKYLV